MSRPRFARRVRSRSALTPASQSRLIIHLSGECQKEKTIPRPCFPDCLCHRSLSHQNVTVRSLYKLSPFGYSVCILDEVSMMRIRTATDLGAFIRERRTKLGMDQIALAKKAGTSRKWLVEVEQGKPRAEIGLILRTLKSLDVSVDLKASSSRETPSISNARTPNINSVLDALKKRP